MLIIIMIKQLWPKDLKAQRSTLGGSLPLRLLMPISRMSMRIMSGYAGDRFREPMARLLAAVHCQETQHEAHQRCDSGP